jgi:hypothetical protein
MNESIYEKTRAQTQLPMKIRQWAKQVGRSREGRRSFGNEREAKPVAKRGRVFEKQRLLFFVKYFLQESTNF